MTSDEEVILVNFTVEGETTQWGDVLLDGISSGGGVVGNTTDLTSTETVDLLVDLSTGVVTLLTRAGNRPFDGSGMPSTDTSDLTETSVSLSSKLLGTKSLNNTLVTFTLGNSNSVNALVGFEDLTDGDLLFELAESPVDLLGDVTTINLDFHDLSLVLSKLDLADLSSSKNADNSAVLLDAFEVSVDGLFVFSVMLVLVSVLGESLFLGVHPVLVEAAFDIVVELGSPDSLESTEATRSLNVTNKTNNLHGWALEDGASVNDVLLDDLFTFTTFLVLDDVGHTSLVADESSKVNWLGGIILGE